MIGKKHISYLACLALCGCSAFEAANQKSNVMAKANVFSSGADGTTTGTVVQPGGGSGSTTQPGSTPVTLICSDKGSSGTTSYQAALTAGDTISLDVNGQVCTSDVATITSLLESGSISSTSLSSLCASAIPTSGSTLLTLLINGQAQNLGSYGGGRGLSVIWDDNPQQVTSSDPTNSAQSYCTHDASPLVIHIPQDSAQPLPLALSPANSILFDLLGATDGHAKVRIDWFTNLDYRLLTLPNAQGEVSGIDQLFGNNTTGPDGLTAANGYAALAKYDGMSADGLVRLAPAKGSIDKSDAIYPLLRVWLDKNFDGIAQADELVGLADVGIASIDLDYSNSYPEADAYGNMTKMKSVVGLASGGLDLIFDLWFSYTTR